MLRLILWKSISVCYNTGYWSNLESRHHVRGRKEGSRERRKKKENFGPSSQKSSCVLWCSEKKRVVSSPPEVTQQEQIPSLSCCLCSSPFPYLRGAVRMYLTTWCFSWEDKQVKGILFTSLKVTMSLDIYWDISVILLFSQWRVLNSLELGTYCRFWNFHFFKVVS